MEGRGDLRPRPYPQRLDRSQEPCEALQNELKKIFDLRSPEGRAAKESDTEVKCEAKEIASMKSYGPWHNTYTAIYFTLTGLHALHVIGGAFVIFCIWGPLSGMWQTDPERYTNRIEIAGLYWHFVDLVWIFLFPTLYLL